MKIIRPVAIASLDSSNVAENDYSAYDAAHTYAVGDRVIVVADHKIYESLVGSNTGNTPLSSPSQWLMVGATNRWKMFDTSVTSQTTHADTIDIDVTVTGRADSVALLNIAASTVDISMTDATDGVVYSRSFSMTSSSGITDWYKYFFEPVLRKTDLVVNGLPPYGNAQFSITLNDTGNTVACGACVIGQSMNVGQTVFGAKVGIQDYSIKQRDTFGNYTVLERAFNKYADFTVVIDNDLVDRLEAILAQYRATPIVYQGSAQFGSMVIYGFYKNFSIEIAYQQHSICSIEVEGLT